MEPQERDSFGVPSNERKLISQLDATRSDEDASSIAAEEVASGAEALPSSSLNNDPYYKQRCHSSDALAAWPAEGIVKAEKQQMEQFSTPLAPRKQSKKDASEGSRGAKMSADTTLTRRRSTSSDNVPLGEDQKGYRRMERALEARSSQQKNSLPASSRDRSTLLSYPDRSSSRGRPRRSVEGDTSKTNRNRTLSEPLTALNLDKMHSDTARPVSEDTRSMQQQVEADDIIVYQPTQTRPLSLEAPLSSTPAPAPTAERLSNSAYPAMPWDTARSLSSRMAAGEVGAGRMSHDYLRGHSMSTRPSLNIILENRALARFHLSAISAMRPRLPSPPYAELTALVYKSWLLRLHHMTLFLFGYMHVLATLFFDYNVLFSLIQVALHPNSASSSISAAWWIASGLYAASTLLWFIGVVVVWEYIIQYRRRSSSSRPFALPVYLSSSAFMLTSIRSFSLYSLLFRARLSAQPRDFIVETFWFYSQNWPTVLTLIPRGVILTIFLVLYNPYTGSGAAPSSSQMRDSTYFDQSSGLLTTFSFGILLANASWIAWRLLVLMTSYAGLFFTLGYKAMFERGETSYEGAGSDGTLATASRQEAMRQRAFSSTMIHQPLLAGAEDYHYSSLEAQGYLRDDRYTEMPAFGHDQQPVQGQKSATSSIQQLPRWAWKSRAEERLQVLLIESSQVETEKRRTDAASLSPWSPSRHDGQHAPETAVHPEMQQVSPARVNGPSRSGSVYRQASDAAALEMRLMPSPILFKKGGGDGRPSYSSEARRSVEFSAIPVADGNMSRSRTSLQKVGEKRGRLSSSSELSVYGEATGRASAESRGSELTPSASSKATMGQGDPSPSDVTNEVDNTSVSPGAATSGTTTPRAARKLPASTSQEFLRVMQSDEKVDKMEELQTASNGKAKANAGWWSSMMRSRSRPGEEPQQAVEQKEEQPSPAAQDEEAASERTHDTEDSEEARLWSQFPEQSRRYPPGFIALDLEQKRLSLEEERRLSGEHPNRDEAGDQTIGQESPCLEGLRPIEEESYGHSHENASEHSRSHSQN